MDTNEWQKAGALYTSFFILVNIFKYGDFHHLNLNRRVYDMITRWQMIDLFSRVLIGLSAPSYIHYLIILEVGLYFFRSIFLSDQKLMDLWWRLIGLAIGYLLATLPSPQQFYEDPYLPSPSAIVQRARSDIISSQRPNPWLDKDHRLRLQEVLP